MSSRGSGETQRFSLTPQQIADLNRIREIQDELVEIDARYTCEPAATEAMKALVVMSEALTKMILSAEPGTG